jgi:L-ascorbate metabolism protein UlaG (beta-lactamase superfamily)
MQATGSLTIEWFGCATFRVRVAGRTLFFDTYLDRPPGVPDVGLTSTGVDQADFAFISHAHFDHMLGADVIAGATGATIVGSYETARILRGNQVPDDQVLPVSGGETVRVGDDIRVRVLPSLHSCLFATATGDSGAECLGDLGVSAQERRAKVDALVGMIPEVVPDAADYLESASAHSSGHDGGQLAYLLETPEGSIFVSGSSGYWAGLIRDLRPDVAVLALNGRPNIDGEPHQGSLASFLLGEVELLRPGQVVLCHHDALLPPVIPAVDTGEALATLAREAGHAHHVELSYGEPVPVLARA